MENTQESTQVPAAQIEQVSQFQESLTPTLLKENDSAYESVRDLREALKAEDVLNIALTGPYGSGKSSVLHTLMYLKDEKWNYLPISLATLDDDKHQKTKDEETEDQQELLDNQTSEKSTGKDNFDDRDSENYKEKLNRRIEYSILQQLIYRETIDTLPNSRFKRITHITPKHISKLACGFIGTILAFAILFEPSWMRIDSFYRVFSQGFVFNLIGDIVALLYLLFVLYTIAQYVIRIYGSTKLNKLNFKDGEIEIKDENSIFNRHLDEILYFFQATDYDVVVIEDLDRFDTPDIFLKLRELNFLLNNSAVVGRKIKFIYAVKDDMFKDSSRTKFFDYITTVIPVINPSNSKDKLKEELEKRGHKEEIKADDLEDIAFFIDDMRLLKNIANEYHQYHKRLFVNGTELSHSKLLAMIVYKNYYPDDFSALHNRRGKVYQCVCHETKQELTKFALQILNKRKEEMAKRRETKERNRHLKAGELRMIYVNGYVTHINGNLISIKINDNYYETSAIWKDEDLFNELIQKERIEYKYFNSYSIYTSHTNIRFSEIEKKIDPKTSYAQRLAAITTKDKDLAREEEELKKEEYRINSFSLKQLFMQFKMNECEAFQKIKLAPMMDLFIRRGYIDEDYYDYISYFYPNTISQNDRLLLIAMKLDKSPEYNAKIDKIQSFVAQLPTYAYLSDSVLNINLLDYLGKHTNIERERFLLFMARLEQPVAKMDFLAQYYKEGKQNYNVFNHYINWNVNDSWTSVLNCEYRDILIEAWLKFCENSHIGEFQKTWLKDNYDYLANRYDCFDDKKINFIASVCCYEELTNTSKPLLELIIKGDSYTLTRHNISLLLNHISDRAGANENNITLTRIKRVGRKDVIERIQENMEECIQNVFQNICDEDEESMLEILNNKEVKMEVKQKYLKTHINPINDVSKVKDDMKGLAFGLDLLVPNWDNITNYYVQNDCNIDDVLWAYLDKHAEILGTRRFAGSEPHKHSLFNNIMGSNRISINSYKQIFSAFLCKMDLNEELLNLEDERISYLIDQNSIEYTEDNIRYLSRHSDILYGNFLLHHKNEFLKDKDKIAYNKDLALCLLGSYKLSGKEKSVVLQQLKATSIDVSQKLANIICEILTDYETEIDYDLLKKVLVKASVLEKAITVIYHTIRQNQDNHDVIDELLALLPLPYSKMKENGKHPIIPDTELNRNLLSLLKECNYISSFSKDKNGLKVNTRIIKQ